MGCRIVKLLKADILTSELYKVVKKIKKKKE